MKTDIEVTLSIPKYDRDEGVRISWVDWHEIFVSIEDDQVIINANSEGLRTLATQLLTLAQDGMPAGNHMHLMSSSGLDEGSLGLTLQRKQSNPERPA